jgi:hypothetical protein
MAGNDICSHIRARVSELDAVAGSVGNGTVGLRWLVRVTL